VLLLAVCSAMGCGANSKPAPAEAGTPAAQPSDVDASKAAAPAAAPKVEAAKSTPAAPASSEEQKGKVIEPTPAANGSVAASATPKEEAPAAAASEEPKDAPDSPKNVVIGRRPSIKENEPPILVAPVAPAGVAAPGSVPTYWHHKEGTFDDKFEVPESRRALLQELVRGCAGNEGSHDETRKLVCKEALRVEDSLLWNQYLSAKTSLKENRGKCKAPPDVADRKAVSKVVTEIMAGQPDAPILTSTLDLDVNEFYLWHGTSKAAWSAIAEDGFLLGTYGGRYGSGFYFAENSTKALEYAKDKRGSEQEQCLLLCRVVLGEPYFTTASSSDRIEKVREGDKDSLLADPHDGWAREIVVAKCAKIYPEYALTFAAEQTF